MANSDSYNQLISTGNVLPWLQETSTNQVWLPWHVTYRDVRILDSSNRLVSVFNLTTNDLGDPVNYQKAKALFLSAANAGDSDGDGLPDHWENKYFSGTSATKDADSDNDGFSNFLEFAFGTNPVDPNSRPGVFYGFNLSNQFAVSFDRWSGGGAAYLVEMSTNLTGWSSRSTLITRSIMNLYDGTGRARVIYALTSAKTTQPVGYTRINVQPAQ